MNFLAWIVLGLIAGAIAKAIMPGNDPGGIIVTMIIGIVGALIGGSSAVHLWGHRLPGSRFRVCCLQSSARSSFSSSTGWRPRDEPGFRSTRGIVG